MPTKLNLIDRALLELAPLHAARRLHARAAALALSAGADAGPSAQAISGDSDSGAGGVAGGGTPLLRWWRPGVRDAATDTLRHLPMQRGQSRELARTNPIAAGAIKTNIDRVVGTGLALVAAPDARVLGWSEARTLEWKRQAQTEFSLWADSPECDYYGRLDFYDSQRLVCGASLESGDAFTVLPDAADADMAHAASPYRLRVQILEADRVGNPQGQFDSSRVAGGVRLDDAGRPQGYHVYRRHPGNWLPSDKPAERLAGAWIDLRGRTARRRILHHLRMLRPEQPRGVPYLAPVVECLKQLGRYTEAEIQAAVVSAFFTVFIETGDGNPAPVFAGGEAVQSPDGADIALGPAAVVGLARGEKATFADPKRPNTAFEPFVLAIVRQIGIGLGLPYELLVKQFNSSYSASKAALLDAWMHFRGERTWLARSFCQPVYETWLAEAVATGRIAAPGFFRDPLLRWAYTRAGWHGDSQGSLNPKDEVEAYTAAIDARLMTRERAEWELFGTDWDLTTATKAREQRRLEADDMLPVPKAGAAAPATPAQRQALALAAAADQAARAEQAQQAARQASATEALVSSIATLAAREAPAAQVTVNNAPPAITVQAGDHHVHMDAGMVQLEAQIQPPHVTVPVELRAGDVHVDVPAAQVVVQQAPRGATRQRVERDPTTGEMTGIFSVPVEH
jgi:lambda family phage portal protein